MRTFTLTMILALTMGAVSAMPGGSHLQIELIGHRPQTMIVFNGQRYVPQENTVVVRGLMPGDYPVKVLRPTYWGNQGVLFSGRIHVEPHSYVVALITPRGMKVSSTPMGHGGQSYWDGHDGCSGNVYENPDGNGGFVSMGNGQACCNLPMGMRPEVFNRLKRMVDDASFDSDQIRIIKQAVRSNSVTSEQVCGLIELLSFESSRLEIAKFCYRFVADPGNYFVVNDAFWFSSSTGELDRFINNQN